MTDAGETLLGHLRVYAPTTEQAEKFATGLVYTIATDAGISDDEARGLLTVEKGDRTASMTVPITPAHLALLLGRTP